MELHNTCVSPNIDDATVRCSNLRINTSLHCKYHALESRKLYNKYKSHDREVMKLIVELKDYPISDENIYRYLELYSHLQEEVKLRTLHRAQFFVPELYDEGHDNAIIINQEVLYKYEMLFFEYFSDKRVNKEHTYKNFYQNHSNEYERLQEEEPNATTNIEEHESRNDIERKYHYYMKMKKNVSDCYNESTLLNEEYNNALKRKDIVSKLLTRYVDNIIAEKNIDPTSKKLSLWVRASSSKKQLSLLGVDLKNKTKKGHVCLSIHSNPRSFLINILYIMQVNMSKLRSSSLSIMGVTPIIEASIMYKFINLGALNELYRFTLYNRKHIDKALDIYKTCVQSERVEMTASGCFQSLTNERLIFLILSENEMYLAEDILSNYLQLSRDLSNSKHNVASQMIDMVINKEYKRNYKSLFASPSKAKNREQLQAVVHKLYAAHGCISSEFQERNRKQLRTVASKGVSIMRSESREIISKYAY